MKFISILSFALLLISCNSKKEVSLSVAIEKADAGLDSVVSSTLQIQVLGTGYEWSEGPVWVESEKMLLFSDVPKNTIYKWTAEKGSEVYLTPSGYTGTTPRDGEGGSNGLTLNDEGDLILCQHGDRRIALMNTSTAQPTPEFTTIADRYEGKRFNSPNDVVFYNYDYYFTDPPYGLPQGTADSSKEIPFQGVYRATTNGKTILLIDSLTRPNGLAFMPGGKKLIVANSDPEKARWYEYTFNDSMQIVSGKILYDATANAKTEKGLPDGLKIDSKGTIFGTGPGGVWIFNADGKLLGKIKLQEATSNCALSTDEKALFVTNDMQVLKIQLRP
ncbi:MAG: SMP-30/gluconolactonase/LRE family protein [Cyclobacteriaceae bacterium]|nr:SMP-30/gluconolactonase/LRE family protein [Cyclobacteriaceae bacterium]